MANNIGSTLLQAAQRRQASIAEGRQTRLQEAIGQRKLYLDPSYEVFNPDQWEVIDFDTFFNPETKETLRLSGGKGRTLNAFETEASRYEGDPDAVNRYQHHRRTYAKLYGKDVDDVTMEDLTNLGKVQKQRMLEGKEKLRGVGFTRTQGDDKYNRTLAQFDDLSAFEDAMGQDGNASYFAPHNYQRLSEDIASGEFSQLDREERSVRQAVTDQVPNFIAGTGRIVNDLGQAVNNILRGNTEGTDKFFENNRKRLEAFKENWTSQGQQDREKFAGKKAGLSAEIFNVRKNEYLEQGESEAMASIMAGLSGYWDTFNYLIDEPGRILDAAIESLPYMIGVGAVGRAVAAGATRKLTYDTLVKLRKAGGAGNPQQVRKFAYKYINGKEGQAIINRAANTAGISAVGLTEGMSNSAEAYASVVAMSEEEAQQSEKYQALREAGKSHREALVELGENVFWQTLVSTTALAAAASAATGAGAFEAGLFRTTRKIGKEAGEEAKDGLIKATAKTAGRGAKYVTGPGLREFAEESIQSGGGEFLSQLAEYDEGLIDQVGPGIGEATAEGGIVGFASGAGAATVTGGPKVLFRKLADINNQFSESKMGQVKIRSEKSPIPGGASRSTPVDTGADPYTAFMDQVTAMTNDKTPDVSQYKELESFFMDSYEALTPEQRQDAAKALQTMRHLYHGKLKQEVDQVLEKPTEEYTEEDRQTLFSAVEEKLITPDQVEGPLGEVLKRFAAADQLASAAIDDASDEKTIETIREVTGQSDQEYRRVAQEKLDDVHSAKGPGLKRHVRLLKEAARINDSELWGERAEAFERFLSSQETKVNKVQAFLDAVTQEGADVAAVEEAYGLKYIQGSTEAYLKILQNEQQKMNAAVQEVTQAYDNWKAVEATTEAEATPVAPEPETTTEPAPVEPETVPEDGPVPESENPAPPGVENEEQQTTTGEPTVTEEAQPEDQGTTEREVDTTPEETGGTTEAIESEFPEKPEHDIDVNAVLIAIDDVEEFFFFPEAQAYIKENYNSKDFTVQERVGELTRELTQLDQFPTIYADEATAGDKVSPTDRDIYLIKDGSVRVSTSNLEYLDIGGPELDIIEEQGDIELEFEPDEIELEYHKINSYVELEQDDDTGPILIARIEDFYTKSDGSFGMRLALMEYSHIDRNQETLNLEKTGETTETVEQDYISILEEQYLDVANEILVANDPNLEQGEERARDANIATRNLRALQANIDEAILDQQNTLLASGPQASTSEEAAIDVINATKAIKQLEILQEKVNALYQATEKQDQEVVTEEQPVDEEEAGAPREAEPTDSAEAESEVPVETEEELQEPVSQEPVDQASAQTAYNELQYFNHVVEGYLEGYNSKNQMLYILELFGVTGLNEESALDAIVEQVRTELEQQVPEQFTPVEVDEQTLRNLSQKTQKLGKGEAVYGRDWLKDTTPITDESRMEQLFRWAGMPFGENPENAFQKVLKRVRDGYQSGKKKIQGLNTEDKDGNAITNLPEQLSEHFTRRSEKVRSLLSSVKDLAELLDDRTFRATFREKAKLNVGEDIALNRFIDFRHLLAGKFNEMIQDLNHPLRGQFAGTWLQENPLYYFKDQLGQMDSNVITAMAMESMNWLTSSRVSSTNYMMNKILGQDGDTQLTNTQVSMLSDKVHLRTQVYEQIGNAAIKQLNIKRRDDSKYDAEMYDKLAVAIGLAAIATMKEAGYIQIKKLPRSWLADNSQLDISEKGPPILFVHPTPSEDPNSYDAREEVVDIRESWEVGKRVFEEFFGVKSMARWPQKETPKYKDSPEKISRSLTRVSKIMRDRIDRMQRRPWKASMSVISLVNRFVPEDLLALSYEYDTDLDSVHSEHEKARKARNDSYLLELQQARKWGEDKGNSVFHFTYHMSQSGRTFISSNTINPQTSKLHRFMFGMEAWNTAVDVPKSWTTDKLFDNFMLSVAQGMDIDIDKLSQRDALWELREKLNLDSRYLPRAESSINQVLEIINGDGTITQEQIEILRPFVEDTGVHALAALQAYNAFVQADAKGEATFDTNLPIETDGITNGLSLGMMQTPTGLAGFYQKIKNMLRATGIMFEDDPASFASWIRNGKNKDNYVDTANRVGDFIHHMMNGNFLPRANDNRLENLQNRDELIRKRAANHNLFQSNFLPSMEELFADGGKGRKWAKNPLMITGYGASLFAVINSIAEVAYDKFLEDIAKTNDITADVTEENAGVAYNDQLQAMLNLINQAYDFVQVTADSNVAAGWYTPQYQDANVVQWTMDELVGKLERDYEGDIRRMAREFTLDQNFPGTFNRKTGKTNPDQTAADLFKTAVSATYGEAMAVALEEKLQPVEQIRQQLNAANKLMNEVFVQDYVRRIVAYQERLGNRMLNKDERDLVFEQMFAKGLVPSVAMAYSNPDDLTENLETTNYDKTTVEESQVNLVLTRGFQILDATYDELTDGNTEPPTQSNITAALLKRIPDTNVGVSAVVKLIHALDGANNSFAWGNKWSVLNMHDAQISSIDQVDEVVNGVNKDLRELMGNYSLPGSILQALERMQPLLNDTDHRLDREQKDGIYKAFAKHLLKHRLISEEQAEAFTPREIYEDFVAGLKESVTDADQARKRLLDESTAFGQYSLEGLEYVIKDEDYSFKGYEPVRDGEQEQKRQNVVDNLLLNYQSGNLRLAVIDWINKDRPDFRTALQIIQSFMTQAFEDSTDPEIRNSVAEIRKLTSLLWPHLGPYAGASATRIITVPELHNPENPDEKYLGVYVPSEDTIKVSSKKPTAGISIIDTLMHELLHAANSTKVWKMQYDGTEITIDGEQVSLFEELKRRALEGVKELEDKVPEKARSSHIIEALQKLIDAKQWDQLITEYISYMMASYARQDTESVIPGTPWENILPGTTVNATKLLVDALRVTDENAVGGLVLHSSPNEVNHVNFAGKSSEQIESKNLETLFNKLGQLEQLSKVTEHRYQLQNLIDKVLLPGLKSIAPLMYQYGTDPGSMKHAGNWRASNNLVQVQSAGNPLTNNAEMSLQEIFTHEVLHAISKAAFGDPSITDEDIAATPNKLRQGLIQMRQGNPKIRNEIERIFEQVRDAKDENGDPLITWESFMPETVVGDRQAAENAAKARYDHIFNGGAESIHEFFSIALTNHEFATVLSGMTNKDTRGPIWDGGILSSLMNILDRITQWITGQMLKTNQGSIHASIFSLAQTIVDFNDRAALELDAVDDKKLLRNKLDEWILRNSERFMDGLQERLRRTEREQRLDTSLLGTARNAAHAALVRRRAPGRELQNLFLKQKGLEKNHWVSRIASEVVSYNEEDKGTGPGQPGFIDLLGHSKYQIDVARQRMIEHSRDTLQESFDPDKRLTVAQRESLTMAVLRTDLDGLFENDPEVNDLRRLLSIIRSEQVRVQELERATSELRAIVADQKLSNMMLNQAQSMASLMVRGKATLKNSMMNSSNIVKQYNRAEFRRQDIPREADAIAVMERIGSLMAMGMVSAETRQVASEALEHELDRQVEDNGFSTLLGMHSDFKTLAKTHLFKENPTQVMKGYVYEMLDDDINIAFIKDIPSEHRRMKELGMVQIAVLGKDSMDRSTPDTVMYKGLHGGLGGYQKSIVSLTNMQHRGHNLYAAHDYDSQSSLENLGRMRTWSYNRVEDQKKPGWSDDDQNMVPVLDELGNIVDYRYMMTEEVKKEHFKKRDEFDKALPRMFGTISDRVGTKDINRQVVDLLYAEHQKYGPNSPDNPHRFVMVGESVPLDKKGQIQLNDDGSIIIDKNAQAMWRLLPNDMKREIEAKFGTKAFPIRDNAVNLVLGFRKLSIADNKYLGKSAFITRTAEKVWLEAMQFLRIKVALLTPEVVIGNTASNYAILLSEGIPVNYIRKMTGEALKGIRKYQKDVRRLDKANRYIGIRQSQGKNTRVLEREAERLEANLRANPVDQLIQEGMFTSIVEDLGTGEDTLRERGVDWLLDHTHGKIPAAGVKLASEVYMIPGTRTFHAAQLATQYGDFVGRYIKYKYDTEVRGKNEYEAKHDALAAFIYYDMPQHRSLQFANDYGFVMFTKFFARIQHVVANLFLHNPTKAAGVLAVQQALAPAMMQENIANYALMQGATRKFEPVPLLHLDRIEPWDPSLLMWLKLLGIGG